MHNTSEEFYKYLSKIILDFFKSQSHRGGERFNIYLENDEAVEHLYTWIKEMYSDSIHDFTYKHQEGDKNYKTYTVKTNDTELLIVASNADVTENFITTIRNQIARQEGQFKKKNVLILFSGKLDSLLGGSESLFKEGMPLHMTSFKSKMIESTNSSTQLKKFEKIIINDLINKISLSSKIDSNSIFDFEYILGVINKGKIAISDYPLLGLFPHTEIHNLSEKDIKQNIDENSEVFEQIEYAFKHGDPENDLDRLLSDKGIKELKSNENWQKIDYSDIRKWIDERKKTAPLKFLDVPINEHSDGIEVWHRADGYTEAQKRKINVIIFNPINLFPIKVAFRFDKPIRKDPLKSGKDDNVELNASGHRIIAKFNDDKQYRWISYTEKETGKSYDLKIMILPISSYFLEGYKKRYIINKDKKRIDISVGEDIKLLFNTSAAEEETFKLQSSNSYPISKECKLILKINTETEEEKTDFSLQFNSILIPLSVISSRPSLEPISGIRVWKMKREQLESFQIEYSGEVGDSIKLLTDNQEYTVYGDFRNKLMLEHKIIYSEGLSWTIDENEGFSELDIKIPDYLSSSYTDFKNYYTQEQCLPSLTHLNDELKNLAKKYLSDFLKVIDNFEEGSSINEDSDLLKLGILSEQTKSKNFYLTPLHPLIVAYQLELDNTIGTEELYDAILKRLTPLNLLPYIRWENKHIYSPIENSSTPEWLTYTNKTEKKKGIAKEFVRKLIQSKISEFTKHFKYLFSNINSPIILNTFNLGDCKEVLQGVFDFYLSYIKTNDLDDLNYLPPIEINIYGSEKIVTKLEELAFYDSAKEVMESDLDLQIRDSRNWDADDLLNYFRQKVHFYKRSQDNSGSVEYAHITFFNFDQSQISYSSNFMEQVPTGMSLNGLISDLSSEYNQNSYRTGFGTKYINSTKSTLEEMAIAYNSLVLVAYTENLYRSNEALCTTINYDIKNNLEEIYNKSQWVTFIEPKVGLDFFKEKENLYIIHYSDQYNNASGYDAITVTKKTDQYAFIIEEFLKDKNVPIEDSSILKIINLFNAVNGDWLLKLIAQNSQFPREKISLISGIKALFALYFHPDIIWVPVSLEEVLRVSGNVGLKQAEGIFSVKNLGKKGSISDDILMIGLKKDEDQLTMHLYPVEVKIGDVTSNVIEKAKEQGNKTSSLLKEVFQLKEGEDLNHFKVELYKNFFAKLAIINANKYQLYKIWPENNQSWESVLMDHRKALLNNNFKISHTLETIIGNYGIISFNKNVWRRKVELLDNGFLISLPEQDGYNFLVKPVSELKEELTIKKSSINSEFLLYSRMNKSIKNDDSTNREPISSNKDNDEKSIDTEILSQETEVNSGVPARPVEILFGHNNINNHEVKWYPSTTSKVLHTNTGIIGTMGTGKTQFTKSLVTQLVRESKYNVGSKPIGILIFDYKGDYIGNDFVKATGAKVFDLFHLPYNPLTIDVYENALNLLPLHTASTIKETISRAYGLGKKQEQALRNVIMECYESKGIFKSDKNTWNKPAPTIADVCDLFMSDENVSQDSLYAALDALHEFEIFEPDSNKTQSLFDLLNGVLVINLSGYDESVQNLVVAITLDLFYSQMQKAGHSKIDGDFRQLNKMILVDEADNFLSKNFNSIRKILKEGREFGVGTILSTQFLSHFSTGDNDYSTYILTWIVHRVNEIRSKEVESLFKLDNKDAVHQLMNEIKDLEKHYSVVNLAGSEPLFIRDRAFWELVS